MSADRRLLGNLIASSYDELKRNFGVDPLMCVRVPHVGAGSMSRCPECQNFLVFTGWCFTCENGSEEREKAPDTQRSGGPCDCAIGPGLHETWCKLR